MGYLDETKKSNKITIRHTSNIGDTGTEIFYANFTVQELNADTVKAAQVDTWAKGYVNLSLDSYDDSKITSTNSVERIARGE